LEDTDYEDIQAFYEKLDESPLDNQSFIPPFQDAPVEALAGSASEDGAALITPVFFDEEASTDELQASLDQLSTKVTDQFGAELLDSDLKDSQLHVRFSGPVGIQTDAVSLFSNADITLLMSTVLLVFILLIVLYRSPILAIVPLVAVGIAYVIISPLLGFFAEKGWIVVDSQAISIMTVLLFGAGTDYCLFLISRYRDELRHEENKYMALKKAVSGTGGAIMMSSMTTGVGLLSLALAYYASYDRFAIPFSLSIFIMGIAALRLLPSIPRPEKMIQEMEEKKGKKMRRPKPSHRFGKKLGKVVTGKPWTIIVLCVIVLGSLAAFVPKMQFTYGLLDSFPEDMPSREGFTLISDHYPPGEIAPVSVMVDTHGEDVSLKEQLEEHTYVEEVTDSENGADNEDLQKWEVTLSIDSYSTETVESIPELQAIATSGLEDVGISNAENDVWLSGETATLYDTEEITSRDQSVIIPVLLLIIALLLFVYLKSIVAMLYLLATVLL